MSISIPSSDQTPSGSGQISSGSGQTFSGSRQTFSGSGQISSGSGQPFSSSLWIQFQGKLNRTSNYCVLHPSIDERIQIIFENDDVMERSGTILLRLGSRARSINIPSNSILKTRVFSGSANQKLCTSNTTMCVGQVELCCDNGQTVGPCVGYWICP